MSCDPWYTVWCDATDCPNHSGDEGEGPTAHAARSAALAHGWARVWNRDLRVFQDLCPSCAEKWHRA